MREPFHLLSRTFLLCAVGALALLACDWTSNGQLDEETNRQTQILDVNVTPSPVPVGDTARFTVVIEDSLDTRFQFRWYLSGVAPVLVTDSNSVRWPAPTFTGEFTHAVTADNGADTLEAVTDEFSVEVVDSAEQP